MVRDRPHHHHPLLLVIHCVPTRSLGRPDFRHQLPTDLCFPSHVGRIQVDQEDFMGSPGRDGLFLGLGGDRGRLLR